MGAVAGVAGTKSTKILSGSELDKVIANKFVNEISYELVRNCWRVSVWRSVVLLYRFENQRIDVLFNDILLGVSNNRVLFSKNLRIYSFFLFLSAIWTIVQLRSIIRSKQVIPWLHPKFSNEFWQTYNNKLVSQCQVNSLTNSLKNY